MVLDFLRELKYSPDMEESAYVPTYRGQITSYSKYKESV